MFLENKHWKYLGAGQRARRLHLDLQCFGEKRGRGRARERFWDVLRPDTHPRPGTCPVSNHRTLMSHPPSAAGPHAPQVGRSGARERRWHWAGQEPPEHRPADAAVEEKAEKE